MDGKNEAGRGLLSLVMLVSMSVWAAEGTAEPEGAGEPGPAERVGVLDLNFGTS
jgi:hypothetical protein